MKNIKKKYSFIAFILIFIVLGFFLVNQGVFLKKIDENNIKFVKIVGQMIKVELALTPTEQQLGLSGRRNLKEDEGMLFIFPKSQKNYFWMKDMNFPIDIIWLGENQEIIYLKKDALPSSYPDTFGPAVDNRYVLEVSAGFSEKNNLKEGERVEFLR